MLPSMLRRGALALFLCSIPCLCQAGLTPRLVRDIDETSYAGSSSPRQFGGVEHGVAFTAFGGRELWIHSERNVDFKRVLRREEIRQLGGPFYAAREAEGGWSFWLAEGNPYDSAFPIHGKRVGRLGAVYTNPLQWYSPVVFEADRGTGRGLWTVNYGTGPFELARPLPLEDGSLLLDFTPERWTSYFIARHRTLGTALWKTDGTKAGTLAVTAPSPGQTVPLRLAGRLHRRLLLTISGGEPELWWSDGSPRGLRPFLEIVPGREAATVSAARVVNGRAFLVIDDGRHGRQLWTSDGTAAGTVPITSFEPDPLRQIDLPVLRRAGRWYFVAADGIHGRELWRTDGTPQGTQLVTDLCPGPCNSDPQDLSFENYYSAPGIYFTASAPEGQRALWRTNGTAQGTSRLTPPGVEATTGLQYDNAFSARADGLGDELWITGGTPETTRLWADLALEEDSGSHPSLIAAAGNRVLFQTQAPSMEYGLWTSDGTAAGTHPIPTPPVLLMDEWSSLSGMGLGEHMLSTGLTVEPGTDYAYPALWSTDGTAGVVRLTPPGVIVREPPVIVGSRAVFFTGDAEKGDKLWVSEGTLESTRVTVDLGANNVTRYPSLLRGQLVFQMVPVSGGIPEPWVTDGTAEGTRRLLDVDPSLAPMRAGDLMLVEAAGKVFFFGPAEAENERRLWVSDGTAAGTAPFDFADNTGNVYFEGFYPAGDRLYFKVIVYPPDDESSAHLWITDGTPAGTRQIPARPLDFRLDAPPLMAFGDRLVFNGEDFDYWITDGTAEGTFPLRDARGNKISRYESHSIVFKDQLVFTAIDDFGHDGPCYVWNGTGTTVRQLENLSCSSFLAVGDRLYFNGFQPQTGAELWVMEEK